MRRTLEHRRRWERGRAFHLVELAQAGTYGAILLIAATVSGQQSPGQGETPDQGRDAHIRQTGQAQPSQAGQPEQAGRARRSQATVPQSPPQDRVSELLDNFPPELLNSLLGADVSVEIVGGQVILTGPESAVTIIEEIIRAVDEEVKPKTLRVVQVNEHDAQEIARTVQDAVRDAFATQVQRPEDEVSITAIGANVLLIAAPTERIDVVVEIVKQIDAVPPELGRVEKITFPIKHRRASDVAVELQQIIEKLLAARGQRADQSKIQLIPNNANNTLTVLAPETERAKIEALIAEIDVEPVKGWGEVKLTVFPLIHSRAEDLGQVINDLLAAAQQSQQEGQAAKEVIYRLTISRASPTGEIEDLAPIDLQKPMRIIADAGTNSLIVATVEENVMPIGELIRLMDGVPMAESVDVKLFPLRFADAESLAGVIRDMFEASKELPRDPDGSGEGAVPADEVGKSLVYGIGVVADVRTNTIVVSGRPEQLRLVEGIVGELDKPAVALRFPVRVFSLEYADASRISQLLKDLFDRRFEAFQATGANQTALERERVFLTVDLRSNALIVSASNENYAEIVRIARQLDTKPASIYEQVRLISCAPLSAVSLKTRIDELWERKARLRSEEELPEDRPVVVVDERSNSLIVASSVEDFEEMKSLIEALKARPVEDDTRLFKLEYADATVLAGMLDQLFQGLGSTLEDFAVPTILPDSRSNSLIVAASADAMRRVEQLVERLDIQAGPNTAVFAVYALSHASAPKLAQRMQELFDSRRQGEDQNRTPIVIFAEESTNSLVCSASRDDHLVIQDLLKLLDRPSSLARNFEIFPLRMANAADIAEKLETLFTPQGQGATGVRADAIAVQADERTNSLIVWASPAEMLNVRDVIGRLDHATPLREMMVKVIQLRQALAGDFAELMRSTLLEGEGGGDAQQQAVLLSFLQKFPDGREIERKLLRQDIRIEPDARTNSVMVVAPAESMAMLEAMIKDFDQIRPVTSEIRLFPLINSDARTMVDQLTDLFQAQEGTGGEGQMQSQLVFGGQVEGLDLASVGQELRFAADERTNTLIAAGAEVYLRMVEELVRYLDQQDSEDRVVQVYHAKYRDGNSLATAIQGFVEQEQTILGEADDETSRMRRQDRQISVESIGAEEEEGSSGLIIGTSRRNYHRTMEMIRELDRPEPQVMISVLIAEVNLTDSLDLGVEFAGQDLRFTEGAVQGPNGTIQGGNFDFTIGTNLGAATGGLGGFSFTLTGEDFSFLFRALQQDSRTEVLSRPILLVRNGQEGVITIADQVPFVESSQINDTGSTNSVIGREDVGIVLTVTPNISPDGYVTIQLRQELSNFAGEDLQLTEGVTSPVFQTREVETNVTIRDGETVVIGGLITSRESESESKMPILGDLPLLGVLFRQTSVSRNKTELLIVLTVDILRTDDDIREMSIEQRDKFVLPDSIRRSPLMEGLRILPGEKGLGPVGPDGKRAPADGQKGDKPDERELYGPKPKTYGPVIKGPATTTTAEAGVFGPTLSERLSSGAAVLEK